MRWNWRKMTSAVLVCALCFGMTTVHASGSSIPDADREAVMEAEGLERQAEEGQSEDTDGTWEAERETDEAEGAEKNEDAEKGTEGTGGELTEKTDSMEETAGKGEDKETEETAAEADKETESVEETAGGEDEKTGGMGEAAEETAEGISGAAEDDIESLWGDMDLMPADISDELSGQEETGMSYAVARSSIGISGTSPGIGQVNSYGCVNGVQVWAAPAGGRYRIACYGGAGGDQNLPGDDEVQGGRGSIRQGTIQLEKGDVLYIHVGGNGAGGNRRSHGDGEGNVGGYNGGADSGYDTDSLGNNGRYWTHGSGGGASDVRLGGNSLDDQIMVAGGGGGANKTTAGSSGDSGSYNGRRLYGSEESGGGGYLGGNAHRGGSSYVNSSYFTDISADNDGSTSGQVTIQVISLFPQVRLSTSEGWAGHEVTISAAVLQSGEGLPEAYLSWEKDEEGEDIWTAEDTYTISKNGTYTCRIRDRAGNMTEGSITISNIDRLEPVIREITASDEGWTNGDVILTVLAEDAPGTAEYASSGLPAEAYLWGAVDESGHIIWGYGGREEEDGRKDPEEGAEPDTDQKDPDGEEEGSEDPVLKWLASHTFTVSGNGIYVCRVRDNAGNVTEATYEVTNIDRLAPVAGLVPSTKEWTNEDIRIKADGDDREEEGCDGRSGIQEYGYAWGEADASGDIRWFPVEGEPDEDAEGPAYEDGEETGETEETGDGSEREETKEEEAEEQGTEEEQGPVWSREDTHTISRNGTYICLVRDNAGNEIQLTLTVTNMDRLMPEAVLTVDTAEKARRVTLTAAAEDREATEGYGRSGIKDYCWEMQGKGAGAWTGKNTYIAEKNGTYICRIRDRAGNTVSLTQTITNVDESPAGGSGSGSTLPLGPGQAPEMTAQDKITEPDTSSLLEDLKGIFENDRVQGADGGAASPILSGKEKEEDDENRTDGQTAGGWKGGHAPKKGERKSDGGGNGGRQEGDGKHKAAGSSDPKHGTAAMAAWMLGGTFLLLLFLISYMTQCADIYLAGIDGGYVFRGRRRIIRRRDAFYLHIDRRLYDRAEDIDLMIRPCKGFVRKNKGRYMRVCWETREKAVLIDKEIRLKTDRYDEQV